MDELAAAVIIAVLAMGLTATLAALVAYSVKPD